MRKSNWFRSITDLKHRQVLGKESDAFFGRLRSGSRRRFHRKRLPTPSCAEVEALEARALLTVLTSEQTIVADNVSQFAPGAPGKVGFDKFLGAQFNTGTATIGDFALGTGVQARFGLHGKVGFQVGAFVNPGSVSAVSDVHLAMDVPDQVMLGDVTIGTSFNTSGEAFETASPSLGGYADLVAEIGGIAELEWSVLGFGDTIGGPFGLDLGQELFAINRNDDRQFRLLGERPAVGGEIEKETSKNPPTSLKLIYDRLDPSRDDAFQASVWSVLGDDTKGPTLEKRLGEMTVAAPRITLADGVADSAGRLAAFGESDLATLQFDVSPLIGQALGIGAGLGTTAIDFGIGRAEITTVKLDVGPELALQQSAEVTPHSMLTYEFNNEVEVTLTNLATGEDRMPTDNTGDPNKVTSVRFDPTLEQFSVNFTGQSITVSPTWDYSLQLRNDIDLAIQLGGRLEIGKLDMTVDFPWPVGTQSFTLGPLYSLPFQQNLGAFNVFNDTFTIAQDSVPLAPFTIGDGYMLPEDALVVSTHDDITWTSANPQISLRQAILNANEKDRQEELAGQNSEQNVIYLDSGEYLLTDMIGSSAGDLDITDRDLKIVGTGSTIINAEGIDDRIFDVVAGAGLTLEGVTIHGGGTPDDPGNGDGGGIRNYGNVVVVDSSFTQNGAWDRGGAVYNAAGATFSMLGSPADGSDPFGQNEGVNPAGAAGNWTVNPNGGGGMIYNEGTATFDAVQLQYNSTNTTSGRGGQIYNTGNLTLIRGNISGNASVDAAHGGAIYNGPTGQLVVEATSMSYNDASQNGGAILNSAVGSSGGFMQLSNVTITNNFAAGTGGGISTTEFATIHNTIVSGNNASGGINDISGRPDSLGYNLVGQVTNAGDFPTGPVAGGNNVYSTDPRLSERERLGGVNFVILPHWDSPAVGAGDPNPGMLNDQRGYAPEGAPDIGAAQFIENFTITNFADDWQTWSRSRLGNPTLRDAVVILNEQGGTGPRTINLVAGTYALQVPDDAADDRFGSLDIQTSLSIVGQGADVSIIDASGIDDRVLIVREPASGRPAGNLSLANLSVTGGNTAGDGGGILNRAALTLSEVVVRRNTAVHGGGGISTSATGSTTIVNSVIDDNLAWWGGGLIVRGGSLLVDSSTVSNNNAEGASGSAGLRNSGGGGGAAGFGGAMAVFDGGTVEFRKSTVSNNAAIGGDGGGVAGGETILDSVHHAANGFDIAGYMGGTGGGPNAARGGWWHGADGSSSSGVLETYRVNPGDNVTDFATGGGGGSGVPLRSGSALAVHTTDEVTTGGSAFAGGGGGGGAGATGVSNYCAVVTNCNPSWRGGGGTYSGGIATGFGAGAGGSGTPTMGGGGGGGAAAGGGLFVYSGTVTVTSSTITENTVHGGEGGQGLAGTPANPGEDAVGSGGGAFVFSEGTLAVRNSIVAGNTADDGGLPDVAGWMSDNGWNIVGVDPGLGPLSDNGGFGMTHVPTPQSPALDSGSSPFTFDQRQWVNGVGPADDIGAIESHALIVSSFEDVLNERTLRQALIDAAALPGHQVIELLPGTYTVNSPLVIDSDVTIKGAGADSTIVDGAALTSDLIMVDGFAVTIDGVTVAGPETGRILDLNDGQVDIVRSELVGSENGVPASWPVTDGGLILARSGSVLNISQSTLAGGRAHGAGGVLALYGSAEATIESGTIYGGVAENGADAIDVFDNGTLILSHATISSGQSNYDGIAIEIAAVGGMELHNSIIEGRLVGEVSSVGHNLIGNAAAAVGFVASDIINTNPMLGELTDNGGTTHTVLPDFGSPAIDNAHYTGDAPDQRGVLGFLGDNLDIGAIEREELVVNRTVDDLQPGSLRRAISDANRLPWAAKIQVEAGTYTLQISGSDDVGLMGDLDILGDVSIGGESVTETIIDVTGFGDRGFDVMADASLGLANLTVVGGTAPNGGNVRNAGSLSLSSVEIAGGQADSGGAIANLFGAEVTVVRSLLRENEAVESGGAIDNLGELSVRHSTFSGNSAEHGGGVFNHETGVVSLINVTIAENTAAFAGGVMNETGGDVELLNTLIAQNSTDVVGHFVAAHSVIGNVGSATGFDVSPSHDNTFGTGATIVDPGIGTLTDNGGPTLTYRPAADSLLVDAGLDQVEQGIDPDTNQIVTARVVRDQRGFEREQRDDPAAEHATDVGAVEALFDLTRTVESGATVIVRTAGAGLTEFIEDDLSIRFADPYRSLTVGVVNGTDTTERIEIGDVSGAFEVRIARFDLVNDELEQLPGQVTFADGTVSFEGTEDPDSVVVRKAGDQYKADVVFADDADVLLFEYADVTGIVVSSGGGNDHVQMISSVTDSVTVFGGNGNDTIRAAKGDDVLNGGSGDDSLLGGGGNDRLTGNGGRDYLSGSVGDDELVDMSGHTLVFAGKGHDTVTTGSGNDTIHGNPGNDLIHAGNGHNDVRTAGGDDTIHTGSGNDFISSGSQNDQVHAGAGDDEIRAGHNADFIDAGDGADSVVAGRGRDTVLAGAGNDTVQGNDGHDILVGGDGDDILGGNKDRDISIGGAGRDSLNSGSSDDILVPGPTGHDNDPTALDALLSEWTSSRSYANRVLNLRDGSGTANRANGTVFLSANETVTDDSAVDTLVGSAATDWFFAQPSGQPFADTLGSLDDNELVDLFS